jgi:hypothetical protein
LRGANHAVVERLEHDGGKCNSGKAGRAGCNF